MDSGIGSDPLLRAAVLSGAGAIAVSVVMLFAVALLRARLILAQAREARFRTIWQPLFAQCVDAVPERLPPLARADRESFLRMWNHYHESLRGPAHERLNRMAIAAGMHEVVCAMLDETSLRARLIAIVTLGNLRDRSRVQTLRTLAEDPSPVESLAAAHALLRIEPAPTLAWLPALAAERRDWPLARLASMLAEAGAERVSQPLASAIHLAAEAEFARERLPRLLKLARVAQTGRLAPTIRRVLEAARDAEVMAACLTALSDPRDVALARRFAAHPEWFVRVAAAKVLGRIGVPEDRELLARMLSDPSWWVRYRAAQALAGWPFMRAEELRALRGMLTDRRAAEILDQAMAERA